MRSRTRSILSNGAFASVVTGAYLALSAGCAATPDDTGGGAGMSATGGTNAAAGAGAVGNAGKGGGTGATAGTGGSVSTGGAGGAGAGGIVGKAGTGGSTSGGAGSGGAGGMPAGGAGGQVMMMGGRPGGAGAGGAPLGGMGGALGGAGGAGNGGAAAQAGASGQGGKAGGGGSAGGSSFDPCPTSGDPCKILPLGDSITFGIQYEGAWRVELFHKAVGDSKKVTFVGSQMNGPSMVDSLSFPRNHEGHSGFTIDQMKPFAMTTDVPFMPHMILLHIGTNDTYGGSPTGAPGRLQTLTDLILSTYPNALLVVAKIVPYPSQANNVKLINDSIPDLVSARATQGKHIVMADCFTGFTTQTMLSSDSIHPNQTGYNFMGDQFYSVIKSYLH